MITDIHIEVASLTKVFNRRTIFKDISFSLRPGETLLITGRNGSGKSTLVKAVCGVLSPSGGEVKYLRNGREIGESWHEVVGLVSPYLQLYEEFTATENLQLCLSIRGLSIAQNSIDQVLKYVMLYERRNDQVRTYSSGMKQRMKYAFALVHRPQILLLDEPTSNLDTEGIAMVHRIMDEHRERGSLVVATNDLTDLNRHDIRVDLNV